MAATDDSRIATDAHGRHSVRRFVRPIYAGSSGEGGMRVARALESCLDRKALAGGGGPMSPIR
jgi:hypothetical protein